MNPKLSHALVAVVAFALGAATLHLVTLRSIAADERQLLERARALSEQRPIDLDAIDAFATDLQRRSAILSAEVSRDAVRQVLAGMEGHLRTVIDSRQGIYDHDGVERLQRSLRAGFSDNTLAMTLLLTMDLERANGISQCQAQAGGRDPLQVDADCLFQDPKRREQARAELARRAEAAKP